MTLSPLSVNWLLLPVAPLLGDECLLQVDAQLRFCSGVTYFQEPDISRQFPKLSYGSISYGSRGLLISRGVVHNDTSHTTLLTGKQINFECSTSKVGRQGPLLG